MRFANKHDVRTVAEIQKCCQGLNIQLEYGVYVAYAESLYAVTGANEEGGNVYVQSRDAYCEEADMTLREFLDVLETCSGKVEIHAEPAEDIDPALDEQMEYEQDIVAVAVDDDCKIFAMIAK